MKVQRNLDAKEMSGKSSNKNEDEIPEGKQIPVSHIELGSLHHYLPGSYAFISSINSSNGSLSVYHLRTGLL